VKSRLLNAAAAPEEDLREALADLDLLALRDRYGLGYALDDALYNMVEGPARWARFGRASTDRVLEARSDGRAFDAPAERAYPLDDLLGLSVLVEGTACNWTGEFLRGGRALRRAYGAFARGSTSERRLASVELAEAQRRAFLDRAEEALHLAERARGTFRDLGLEDEAAKAAGARAIALSYLGRDEEALAEFRGALPALAEAGRWNTYVSALNGAGVCLLRLEEFTKRAGNMLSHCGRSVVRFDPPYTRSSGRTLPERYSRAVDTRMRPVRSEAHRLCSQPKGPQPTRYRWNSSESKRSPGSGIPERPAKHSGPSIGRWVLRTPSMATSLPPLRRSFLATVPISTSSESFGLKPKSRLKSASVGPSELSFRYLL
jgi:tetratricopeptide (TPR) repeat protein